MSIQGLNVVLNDNLDYIAELDAANIKEACEGASSRQSMRPRPARAR